MNTSDKSELIGADLDYAVAMAGEEWKQAHRFLPTMTLDPTFKGARILELHDRRACFLEPNNPFRQDPQEYSPSTDWSIGGEIITREWIHIHPDDNGEWWAERRVCRDGRPAFTTSYDHAVIRRGPTPLVAAMRAFVASKQECYL